MWLYQVLWLMQQTKMFKRITKTRPKMKQKQKLSTSKRSKKFGVESTQISEQLVTKHLFQMVEILRIS